MAGKRTVVSIVGRYGLDLYYVENWSLAGDIAILLKTTRAVFAPSGAY